MSPRPLRIGLAWHSVNSGNLGVGALTAAHLAIIDGVAAAEGLEVSYRVIGAADPEPAYVVRPDLEMVTLRLKHFLPFGRLGRAVRGCDLVLDIGAGDSFADLYGAKRALMMIGTKLSTLLAGRPLVLAPQTIGPFTRPWIRRLALAVMARARLVVARDALSVEWLRSTGYRGLVMQATDVALRLPYDAPAPREAGGRVRVGLNVSGLLFNGGYSRDNMFGLAADYPALVRAIIADLVARPEVELHLVAHVISARLPVEDDQRVAEALGAEFPGVIVHPAPADPSAAKSLIAGMDFFLGARMHACIAAFSSGVPVLPMAYSRKFAGLFGALGYEALIDCRKDDMATALAKLAQAYEGRAALAEQAAAGLALGQQRLDAYGDALAALMRKAAAR